MKREDTLGRGERGTIWDDDRRAEVKAWKLRPVGDEGKGGRRRRREQSHQRGQMESEGERGREDPPLVAITGE